MSEAFRLTCKSTLHGVRRALMIATIRVCQVSDPDVQAFRRAATTVTGLQLKEITFVNSGTGQPLPFVPSRWRRQIFNTVHGLSHPGKKPSQRLVATKFVWQRLKKDVQKWVEICVVCSKVHRHTRPSMVQFSVTEEGSTKLMWTWWNVCLPNMGSHISRPFDDQKPSQC